MEIHHWRERWDRGWSGTMSLPRVLSFDDDGEMLIDVPEEIERLRYQPVTLRGLTVSPGSDHRLTGVNGNSFELLLEMEVMVRPPLGSRCVYRHRVPGVRKKR